MEDVKFVEVDGQKFVDDGTGNAKVGEDGQPIPYIEEKTVPYSRFKEVISDKQKLEQQLQELQQKKENVGLTTEEEKKEKAAKDYLKTLTKEVISESKKEEAEKEEQEQKQFNSEIEEVLENNPDVKKADFLKFIEEKAEKYGIESVTGAMSLYREFANIEKKTREDILKKPKMPTSEGSGNIKSYDYKGKSLDQIAEDSKKELR